MIDYISEITNLPIYIINAGLSAIMLGFVSGLIGSFIILRNMSLMGDALSHAVLPGVAISYMLNINILFGASIFGLLASMIIQYISEKSPIKSDTSIGIILSSFFALGIILISKADSGIDLNHVMFGNILAVPNSELLQSFIVLVVVFILIVIFYKQLLLTSFDPVVAEASGVNVKFYHYLLMLMLSVVTVSSLSQVGVVLVIAMLIIPSATAYLWTDNLKKMIILSSLIGVFSGIVGTYISFYYNLATSATIVLAKTVIFTIAFITSPKNDFRRRFIK